MAWYFRIHQFYLRVFAGTMYIASFGEAGHKMCGCKGAMYRYMIL